WQPLPESISPTGAGNAWAMISVDAERELVFVPTGSASPDYHGMKRPGDNKWANSVVALSAKTGELVWGFQLVHHDLWDYDTASQPVLATLRHDGVDTPVVIAGNKTGNLFVLDRQTGVPLFGVEERHVPQSDADGETGVADPTLSTRTAAATASAIDCAGRVGTDARSSRFLSCPHAEPASRGNFHTSERARHHCFPGQPRRHELEHWRLRPGAPDIRDECE